MLVHEKNKNQLWKKAAFYTGVLLSCVFLVVSIISWDMLLGACALAMAVLLFRNVDIITGNDGEVN